MEGSDLRAIRERMGLTQQALADAAEVSLATVARWEKGEFQISAPQGEHLTRIFATTPMPITGPQPVADDPLTAKILEALDRPIDATGEFESFCVSMLGQEGWNARHTGNRGGDDGVDFVIEQDDGSELLGIVTTEQRPQHNFKRSVQSIQKSRGAASVVFCTSRPVHSRMRGELDKIADEAGMKLVKVYDRAWCADNLYGDPHWRALVLPQLRFSLALSQRPAVRKSFHDRGIVGRVEELDRLRSGSGPTLVVGPAGSGRTHLLQAATPALNGMWLTDATLSDESLADSIRYHNPATIMVDDAGRRLASLRSLLSVLDAMRRSEQIRVVASCGTGETDMVDPYGDWERVTLPDLDRDQIVAVIRCVLGDVDEAIVNYIREQAAGCPGLASEIAYLVREHGWDHAVSGQALMRRLRASSPPETVALLEQIAVGGTGGMWLDRLTRVVGQPIHLFRQSLPATLPVGGVDYDASGLVFLRPETLRTALLQQFLHRVPARDEFESLLECAYHQDAAYAGLVKAAYISEQPLPPGLQELLNETANVGGVRAMCQFYPDLALRWLRNNPNLLWTVADIGLRRDSEEFLHELLDVMHSDDRSPEDRRKAGAMIRQWATRLNRYLDDLDWSQGGAALHGRRLLLLDFCNKRLAADEVDDVPWLLKLAMQPEYELTSPSAGRYDGLRMKRGYLPATTLSALACDWESKVERHFSPWPFPNTASIIGVPSHWLHRSAAEDEPLLDQQQRDVLREQGARMLGVLSSGLSHDPAAQSCIAQLSHCYGLNTECRLDPDFELFHLTYRRHDVEMVEANAQTICDRWAGAAFQDVVARLDHYAALGAGAGVVSCREVTEAVCAGMVERAAWSATQLVAELGSLLHLASSEQHFLLYPLIRKLAEFCSPEGIWILAELLQSPDCAADALYGLLRYETLPDHVWDLVEATIPRHSIWLGFDVLQRWVSRSNLGRLLRHGDLMVRTRTALAFYPPHWEGPDAESLRSAWRAAVLAATDWFTGDQQMDYATNHDMIIDYLMRTLAANSELAAPFLTKLVQSESLTCSGSDFERLAQCLNHDERLEVLLALRYDRSPVQMGAMVRTLVGYDLGLFEALLARRDLNQHGIAPLHRIPDADWWAWAQVALDHGYTERDIVHSVLWDGPFSNSLLEVAPHDVGASNPIVEAFTELAFLDADDYRAVLMARRGRDSALQQISENVKLRDRGWRY